jgi:hypothetical protein
MNSRPGSVSPVRFEHHRDALGVGERAPRLSWRMESVPDRWQQAGYEPRSVPGATGSWAPTAPADDPVWRPPAGPGDFE